MTEALPLVLCQPSVRIGCSVCCGLFNLVDCTRERLDAFLRDGSRRSAALLASDAPADTECVAPELVREQAAHICPHQGFLADGKPGCLIHPLATATPRRDQSLFGELICDRFQCPAHTLLNDHCKTVLTAAVDDWYLYAIAIIDPITFSWIVDTADALVNSHENPTAASRVIMSALELRGVQIAATSLPLFQYSVSEYRLARQSISGPGLMEELAGMMRECVMGISEGRAPSDRQHPGRGSR